MRKSLVIILAVGTLAFFTSDAPAKDVTVSLSKQQVAAVCNGNTTYCEKSCGSYTCGYGCGTKGCSGRCLNCPQAMISGGKIRGLVRAAVVNLSAGGSGGGKKLDTASPKLMTPTGNNQLLSNSGAGGVADSQLKKGGVSHTTMPTTGGPLTKH